MFNVHHGSGLYVMELHESSVRDCTLVRFFKTHEVNETGDRFRSCDLLLVRAITISLSDLYARTKDTTDDVL